MHSDEPKHTAAPPSPANDADDRPTREALIAWIERHARPDDPLVGTEQEKFGVFGLADGEIRPATWAEHVDPLLGEFERRFGWHAGKDRGTGGERVALERDGASITLEPGGQFELSGAPLRSIHETCAEVTQHRRELHEAASALGLSYLAVGFHPFATREDVDWMPKGRYRVMRSYLPTRGTRALDMMLRTCTVQANFDWRDEADCARRLKMMAKVSPLVLAMFANSPYVEGVAGGLVSHRAEVWLDVDADRCGTPDFFLDGSFSFERYVDWALSVPMFFVKRNGEYHPYHRPFGVFLAEGAQTPDGVRQHATLDDFIVHLSTLFPEIRLKPHLEVRCPDSVDRSLVCAMPAVCKGILYDDDALAAAEALVADLDRPAWDALAADARTHGPRHPEIGPRCRALLAIARDGLDRQDVRDSKGRSESHFLDALTRSVEAGRCPADDSLARLGPAPGRGPQARAAFVAEYHFAGLGGEID